ncbi:MAG: hypothetical protein ABI824_08940, partial [Acidobacteriota bacterium]
PLLKRIVDARDVTNGPSATLVERMKEVPPQAAIWAAFIGSPIASPKQTFGQKGNTTIDIGKVVSFIQSGSFYLDLQPNGSGKLALLSANDPDAKQLGDALRGMMGLANMMAGGIDPTGGAVSGKGGSTSKGGSALKGGQPQLQKMLDSLRITQEASRVNLYMDQPEPIVEQLLQLLPAPQAKQ